MGERCETFRKMQVLRNLNHKKTKEGGIFLFFLLSNLISFYYLFNFYLKIFIV